MLVILNVCLFLVGWEAGNRAWFDIEAEGGRPAKGWLHRVVFGLFALLYKERQGQNLP